MFRLIVVYLIAVQCILGGGAFWAMGVGIVAESAMQQIVAEQRMIGGMLMQGIGTVLFAMTATLHKLRDDAKAAKAMKEVAAA